MVWWVAGAALGADCPEFVSTAEVGTALDEAEQGFAALAPEVFADHLDEASLLLPCVDALVPPPLAARWHGLVGLRLFTAGRSADARASFAAATAADSTWTLSDRVVPAAHDMRTAMTSPGVGADVETIPAPASGAFYVDGHPSEVRPTERPAVVQWIDGSSVAFTAAVWPGDALPDYPRAAAPVVVASETEARRSRPRWGFLLVSGVAVGTSAALYGMAAGVQNDILEQPVPDGGRSELEQLQAKNHALVVGSAVSAGVAAAGLVTFTVVR